MKISSTVDDGGASRVKSILPDEFLLFFVGLSSGGGEGKLLLESGASAGVIAGGV